MNNDRAIARKSRTDERPTEADAPTNGPGAALQPQAAAPTSGQEDALVLQARAHHDELEQLREGHDREVRDLRWDLSQKERSLSSLQGQLQVVEERMRKVQEPPLIYAYILRLAGSDLSESEVAVVRGSDLLKVSTGAMDKATLGLGQYVWLHPQSYAIIGASDQYHKGIIARVFDIDEHRLVLSLGEGSERRVLPLPVGLEAPLKPGYQLAVLPPSLEVLEVLPSLEVRDLFLGERPNVRYGQIGGHSGIIERIKDVMVLPFEETALFERVDLQAPRGILLHGPPGCGKTMLVKAIATEHQMTFFNVSVADILSKWVGESERIIQELFKQAKERAPSIIFFDEIEALLTTRGRQDTSGVHKNILGQILAEMDGLLSLRDVFVVGATNRPDMLDPALLRPGRFDEIIEVPRPDRSGAAEVLRVYLHDGLPLHPSGRAQGQSPTEAWEALRSAVLDEIYGDDAWIKVKVDPEAHEAVKTLLRRDVISGAILAAVVRTAKKNYVKRVRGLTPDEQQADGISHADLSAAIEEETIEHALTEYYTFQKRQRELQRAQTEEWGDPMVG